MNQHEPKPTYLDMSRGRLRGILKEVGYLARMSMGIGEFDHERERRLEVKDYATGNYTYIGSGSHPGPIQIDEPEIHRITPSDHE